MVIRLRLATIEYAPPSVSQGTRGQWSYDYGKQQMSTSPPRLARDAWSMVVRLRQATIEYAPPSVSQGTRGQWSYDYGKQQMSTPPPSRKGRVVNGHTTKASNK